MKHKNLATTLAIAAIVWPIQIWALLCPGCLGDANGNNNGIVTINELVSCVNKALNGCPISDEPCQCECDGNNDNQVAINELVRAVNNALNGCNLPSPTPTASFTTTASVTATQNSTRTPTKTVKSTATRTATNTPTSIATRTATITPIPTPSPIMNTSAVGVGAFRVANDDEGNLAVAYCDVDCSNIYYSQIDPKGTWSNPELILADWDRLTGYFDMAEFSLAIDKNGNSHVFWGEGGDVFHATRNSNRSWATVNETALLGGAVLGRVLSAHFSRSNELTIATSDDYIAYGYPFSYLGLLQGNSGDTLSYQGSSIYGEKIFDLDVSAEGDNGPVIAVAQLHWGGRHAFKLIHKGETGAWEVKMIRKDYRICVEPARIIVGPTSTHAVSCNYYIHLDHLAADPVIEGISTSASSRLDATIDDEEQPYFVEMNDAGTVNGANVRLIGRSNDRWNSFLVEAGFSVCTPTSACYGSTASILYSRGKFFVVYLGTADHIFRIRAYNKDDVEAYFNSGSSPTETRTPTIALTHTITPTSTSAPSLTTTQTPTLTPTRTRAPTSTQTRTPTLTPTRTLTSTPTPSRTATRTPIATATTTPTATTTQTRTATLTASVTPTATSTPIDQVEAINLSGETLCAENDNVNIPFLGKVSSFDIVATHPRYLFTTDNCEADFTNCVPGEQGFPFERLNTKVSDNGIRVVRAVRQDFWWQPVGMKVVIDNGIPLSNIHYIVIHQKIVGESSWPEVLVLYQDGNLRLKPHKQIDGPDPCFGSSEIVGPAAMTERPSAAIATLQYLSSTGEIYIEYTNGSAVLSLEVDRAQATATVTVNYDTSNLPFTTFRSMFVTDGNADVDHVEWVEWIDSTGVVHNDPILNFQGGIGTRWFFHRDTVSDHNTSAPNISIIPHAE